MVVSENYSALSLAVAETKLGTPQRVPSFVNGWFPGIPLKAGPIPRFAGLIPPPAGLYRLSLFKKSCDASLFDSFFYFHGLTSRIYLLRPNHFPWAFESLSGF